MVFIVVPRNVHDELPCLLLPDVGDALVVAAECDGGGVEVIVRCEVVSHVR